MRLIIFDFDGVVADSESIANQVLTDRLVAIGVNITPEESMRLFMGKRWSDCTPKLNELCGGDLPKDFLAGCITEVYDRITAEVVPVAGVEAFLNRHGHVARCIGSSSRLDYIAACLDRMGLSHHFEHRFSGYDVPNGKPAPDLFLKAASSLGVDPIDCVVIEDAPAGVMAGKAAGMITIGLCAGAHAGEGHAERLREAGADHIAADYEAVAAILAGYMAEA